MSTARRRAISVLRQAIAANMLGMEMQRPISRALSIYHGHFRQRYPRFEDLFHRTLGMTPDEYFCCMCLLFTHYYKVDIEKVRQEARFAGGFNLHELGDTVLPAMTALFRQYAEQESRTPDELRQAIWGNQTDVAALDDVQHFDYRPLRETPILRAPDGRCIVLDPVSYAERAPLGPLFKLKDVGEHFNQLSGAFGDAFESYACAILRTMYPQAASPLLVDQLVCDLKGPCRPAAAPGTGKVKKTEVQVDACLNQGADVVLFEMKAAFVREDKVAHTDPEEYLSAVREKYGVTAGGPNDRPVKGVGQLARAIERLANKEWTPRGADFQLAKRLFPVLVVHDVLLLTPGHTTFLAEEFSAALHPEATYPNGEMQKGQFRVTPLILMTIEDLENLERAIERFALVDLLRDYSAASPDRSCTLRDFVSHSHRYTFVHSGSMASAMMELLRQTQTMAFGDPGTTNDDSLD